MKIVNVLKQVDLIKTYNFEKIIIKLEKLKAITMDNIVPKS